MQYFKELNDTQKQRLREISTSKKYSKNNFLFYEGDKPIKLHLLTEGIVKVYKLDAKGNEVILHFFQPQTLIAESAHMQNMLYPATAICETDCTVIEIEYEKFKKEFLSDPEISIKMINSLTQKVRALQDVISMNLTMDSLARICKFIYENKKHINELSHKKISSILNITPETLSRNLRSLKKDGVIDIQKREIIVLQKDELSSYYS